MILNQATLFLIFMANGAIIGLLFDIFRILRRSFKTSDLITYVEDIIFWILTGIIILYSIFVFNNGEIRLYMFLAIAVGVTLYMLILSSHIIKINVAVITFCKRIIKKILGIIMIPFKLIFKLIKRILFKPISFIIINIRKSTINSLKNTFIHKKEQKT